MPRAVVSPSPGQHQTIPEQARTVASPLSHPRPRQVGPTIYTDQGASWTQRGGLSLGHSVEGQLWAANSELSDSKACGLGVQAGPVAHALSLLS